MSTWSSDGGEPPNWAAEEATVERQVFLERVASANTIEELGKIDPRNLWEFIPTKDLLDYFAKQESLAKRKISELKTPEDLLVFHQTLRDSLGYWSQETYEFFGEKAKEIYSCWIPPHLSRLKGSLN